MKITDVRCVLFEQECPGAFGAMAKIVGTKKAIPHCLFRVLTDEGIEGNCTQFVVDKGIIEHVEARVRPMLIGREPMQHEAIWQELWRSYRMNFSHQFVIGGIDVCLWDIAGKVAGLPIYKLLGAYQDHVPAYASSQGLLRPKDFAEEALKYVEQGYTAYKLHPGEAYVAHPDPDIQSCTEVRKAVGDKIALMMDPYALYNRQQAMKVGKAIQELNYLWYEEPMPEWDIEGYSILCDALEIPVLGPEVIPGSIFSTPEYILRRAIDIVRTDVMFKGGIGAAKKTASMAEAFGMNCELHANISPLSNAANLHVICSVKNTTYYEAIVPTEWFSSGVVEDLKVDKNGDVWVPQKPGLGLEIDWDYISKHTLYETPG